MFKNKKRIKVNIILPYSTLLKQLNLTLLRAKNKPAFVHFVGCN